MDIKDVELFFGNLNKACIALKIAPQNMTNWKKRGYIPWKQQFKLAVLTEGALMPDDEDPFIVKNTKPIIKNTPPKRRKKNEGKDKVNGINAGSVESIGL